MKKIASFLLLLSLSCFAKESGLYEYSAYKAKEQVNRSLNIQRKVLYNECRVDAYKSIVAASRRGQDYTHVLLRGCAGLEPQHLRDELVKKGYRVALEEVGINGIHYTTVMTVSWR